MSDKIDIFLLDKSNNTIEVVNIIKPKSYKELLDKLNLNLKKLPKNFNIFIYSQQKDEIKIDNNEKYHLLKETIFIRETKNNNLNESLFEKNYKKLSESKQVILDEKYNCYICSLIIKNEKPLFCYKCQKIFHAKCLGDWDKKQNHNTKNLHAQIVGMTFLLNNGRKN